MRPPRSLETAVHSDDVNCGPWSDLMSVGIPNQAIQYMMNTRATAAVLVSLRGIAAYGMVDDCQEVRISPRDWQRPYQIHVDMRETSCRGFELDQW